MRRQLLGLGIVAASSLLAMHAAQALTGPQAISINGGPLGTLSLSGGADGYGYALTNTPSGTKNDGANLANALIELQKTTGQLQFTVELGSNGGATTLGTVPSKSSTDTFTTGALYAGYITIAPTGSPVTFSAGQLGSLEGYESGIDYNNAVQLTTAIFYVQNSQSRGVEASYTAGPITATVEYGDGVDSGAWNTLQGLVSYAINSNNSASVYITDNFGKTGPNTFLYGGGTTGFDDPYANDEMIGGYYSYTTGNLNLVPEVQYVYAKADQAIGITKPSSNFGAALFGDYSFGTSPFSLGGWAEYFTSHSGSDDNFAWFVGPNAQAIGAALAPTWQYSDAKTNTSLFVRGNAGYIYLLHNTDAQGNSYGVNGGSSRSGFLGTVEAGVLF